MLLNSIIRHKVANGMLLSSRLLSRRRKTACAGIYQLFLVSGRINDDDKNIFISSFMYTGPDKIFEFSKFPDVVVVAVFFSFKIPYSTVESLPPIIEIGEHLSENLGIKWMCSAQTFPTVFAMF